ncbi:MAG: L-serine ammonia-lyase, iron-sulfur-dependent, subunit alpha [Mycoplasma sp.]
METLSELYRIGLGPSSSHTIGPYRIIKHYLKKYPNTKSFDVYLYGSLALTGKGHQTDVSLIEAAGKDKPVKVFYDIKKKVDHPNTMDVIGYDQNQKPLGTMTGVSTGGGAIEIKGEPYDNSINVFPHHNFNEIKAWCKENKKNLVDYVQHFDPNGFKHLDEVWEVMKQSILDGLSHSGMFDGVIKLSRKAKLALNNIKKAKLPTDSIYYAMAYGYAVAEINVMHGKLVTAPTLGAAGILPAVLYYCEYNLKFSSKKIIEALAVAGVIGNCFKHNGTIAGATGGCQAEQGSACSMAAAAYCYLMNGDLDLIEASAIIAIEHHLGLTCDPILGHVYSPCIERNAQLAMRAIISYGQALLTNGKHELFDLDDVILVQKHTGEQMHSDYKETGLGGLSWMWKKKNNYPV